MKRVIKMEFLCYNHQAGKVYHHPTSSNQNLFTERSEHQMAIPEITTGKPQSKNLQESEIKNTRLDEICARIAVTEKTLPQDRLSVQRRKHRATAKAKKKANGKPDRMVLEKRHAARARKEGRNDRFTDEEFLELCRQAKGRCLFCGLRRKLCVDHIIPLAEGGANSVDNIQPLCQSCNRFKASERWDFRKGSLLSRDVRKQMRRMALEHKREKEESDK